MGLLCLLTFLKVDPGQGFSIQYCPTVDESKCYFLRDSRKVDLNRTVFVFELGPREMMPRFKAIQMKEKIKNILDHLVKEERGVGIQGYKENPDGSYELETDLTQFNHRTLLKYEATADNELFRVEIAHIFALFNVEIPPADAAGQLLRMLAHNTGSFGTTTAFIGMKPVGETFYATLNSFHHFVSKWEDADIARALSLHFFDLTMGLVLSDPALTMLQYLGDQ